jgi:hypothetical protein
MIENMRFSANATQLVQQGIERYRAGNVQEARSHQSKLP